LVVTFNDYNDSSLNNNYCATWLLTYLGPAGGPDEIVNRGSFSLTVADGASTVDSSAISGIVDASKLVALVYAAGEHNSADYRSHCPRVDIVNTGGSTYVLRITRLNTSGDLNVVGRVAEFTGANWSVQKVTHTFAASNTNEDESIDAVDTAHSFTISYMMHTDANQPTRQMYHVWLHNGTTLRHRIRTKPATDPVVTSWIISHPRLNVTRYGTPDGTSDVVGSGATPEAASINITAVPDTTQAMVIGYMGSDTALTTTAPCGLRSFEFADADTITARRSDGLGDSEYVLQVIDFSDLTASRIDSVTEITDEEDFTITGVFDTNPVVTHGGDAVTVNSSNSTTIECTASVGTKRYGRFYTLQVLDDSGLPATIDAPIAPTADINYANLYPPLVVASQRPTTEPMDLDAAVDTYGSVQARWRNVGGTGMTKADFEMPSSGNGRYRPEATSVELSFHDAEWGDWEVQTLGLEQPVSRLSRVVLLGGPTVTASAISTSRIDLSWTAVFGAASYRVYRNGTLVDSPTTAASSSTGLTIATQYSFQVAAVDAGGREGPVGTTALATTQGAAPDVTAPTVPVLALAVLSSSSIRVSLTTASTDAVGVASYTLDRATNSAFTANLVSTTVATSEWPVTVTGLSTSTAYYFRARARDAANNASANSTTSSATTEGGGTTDPLSLPLLGIEHITYAGIANIPTNDGTGQPGAWGRFDFSRGGMCPHPDGTSFYMGGSDTEGHIGRLTIPNVGQTATVVTPLRPIIASASSTGDPGRGTWGTGENALGYAIPYNNRLILGIFDHYGSASSSDRNAIVMQPDLTSHSTEYVIGTNGFGVTMYAARGGLIPELWRPLFGNYPAWCGSTTGHISIIGRYSYGPHGMFLFDPDLVGVTNPTPTIPIVYYQGGEHDFNSGADGDAEFAQGIIDQHLWTGGDALANAEIIPGTRTMLTIGHHGVNVDYTNSTFNGDYWEWSAWFYDVADLVAVYRGERTPQSVVPYARAPIPGLATLSEDAVEVGTGFYRASTRQMYIPWTRRTGGVGPHFRIFNIAQP
jgi:hypothetical protein